jgi:hypothetical protein
MAKRRVISQTANLTPNHKKSKSSWFIFVHVACHISLEIFQWRLQLWFRPHLNRRSEQKIMGFQSCESSNLGNFENPNLKVLRQNDIWVQAPWPSTKNTIRGEGGSFSQIQAVVNLVSQCLPMARLCIKNALTMH